MAGADQHCSDSHQCTPHLLQHALLTRGANGFLHLGELAEPFKVVRAEAMIDCELMQRCQDELVLGIGVHAVLDGGTGRVLAPGL